MSFLFGTPKPAALPPLPPIPAPATSKEEKEKIRRGRVRKSTILTSPLGIGEGAPVGLKKLLGE